MKSLSLYYDWIIRLLSLFYFSMIIFPMFCLDRWCASNLGRTRSAPAIPKGTKYRYEFVALLLNLLQVLLLKKWVVSYLIMYEVLLFSDNKIFFLLFFPNKLVRLLVELIFSSSLFLASWMLSNLLFSGLLIKKVESTIRRELFPSHFLN